MLILPQRRELRPCERADRGKVGRARNHGLRRAAPDWAAMARELKRPGVTIMILREKYREPHPNGYGYSRLRDLLRGFERRLD